MTSHSAKVNIYFYRKRLIISFSNGGLGFLKSHKHFSIAGGGRDMFASVGADGSVRMFDLRHLEHSTIIYEDPQHTPLLR